LIPIRLESIELSDVITAPLFLNFPSMMSHSLSESDNVHYDK